MKKKTLVLINNSCQNIETVQFLEYNDPFKYSFFYWLWTILNQSLLKMCKNIDYPVSKLKIKSVMLLKILQNFL